MAEVQAYQRRMLDLEISVKSLESALAERNALVKVLQKKAFEKPTDTDNVLSIPIHDTLNSAGSILLQAKQVEFRTKKRWHNDLNFIKLLYLF